MSILLIKNIDKNLEDIFYKYDEYAKKVFETKDEEQEKYIDLYRNFKNKIDTWIYENIENIEILIFKDNEYKQKIHSLEARSLLSNGLYKRKNIDEIFINFSKNIDYDIKNSIYKFYDNYKERILIWNINIEVDLCDI